MKETNSTYPILGKEIPTLIAILRGIDESQAVAIGDTLFEIGFRLIEIPLTSPSALSAIKKLNKHLGTKAWVGAGTVLNVAQVEAVYNAGGRLIVSPNFNVEVVRATKSQAEFMFSFPGVMTPTECFAALDAGADGLKIFPAEAINPSVLKALRVVIPSITPIFPVGGITWETMDIWQKSGASGFGLGSALYKTGDSVALVTQQAQQFMNTWKALYPH